MTGYQVTVRGKAAPQGSKRHVGGGRMVEMSKAVGPWREAVRAEVARVVPVPLDGPVHVTARFFTERPKSHYRTGRNAHLLREGAPAAPDGRPDLDKLVRAVLDGMTMGGAWHDDSQVTSLTAIKAYGPAACCFLVIQHDTEAGQPWPVLQEVRFS